MGEKFTNKGAFLRRIAHRWEPPIDPTGLLGAFFHVGELTFSLKNYASGDKKPAVVAGTPVQGSGFVSLKGNANVLVTDIPDQAVGSLVSLFRSTDTNAGTATQPAPVGTYGGSASRGSSLYISTSTAISLDVDYVDSGNATLSARTLAITPANWNMVMGAWDATRRNLYNLTAGTRNEFGVTAGFNRRTNAYPYRIGSLPVSPYAGMSDVAMTLPWSRVLTEAEGQALRQWAQGFMAQFGISGF